MKTLKITINNVQFFLLHDYVYILSVYYIKYILKYIYILYYAIFIMKFRKL